VVLLAFFGFSKPVAEVVIARHFSNIDQFGHNGSGSCDALVLATQHDAKTRIVRRKLFMNMMKCPLISLKLDLHIYEQLIIGDQGSEG
jgi:hypothetical protein